MHHINNNSRINFPHLGDTSSTKDDIKNVESFNRFIKLLKNQQNIEDKINRYTNYLSDFETVFSVFINNIEILLAFLGLIHKNDSYEIFRSSLSAKKSFISSVKKFILLDYINYYSHRNYQKLIKTFKKENRVFLANNENINRQINIYEFKNQESLKKYSHKSYESTICKLLPLFLYCLASYTTLPLFQVFNKEKLTQSLKNVAKIVKEHFKYIKIRDSFRAIKEYRQNSNNAQQVTAQEALKNWEAEAEYFTKTISKKLNLISLCIADYSHDLDDLEKRLKAFGFRVDTSTWQDLKAEIIEDKSDLQPKNDLINKLCEESIRYHITMGKLVANATKQVIEDKISLEKKFLYLNTILLFLDIILNVIELCVLTVPKVLFGLTLDVALRILSKALPVKKEKINFAGIGLVLIVNPHADLTVFGLSSVAITQIFARFLKPSEFSLSSCKYRLAKRWHKTVYSIVHLSLSLTNLTIYINHMVLKKIFNLSLKEFRLQKYIDSQIDKLNISHKNRLAKVDSILQKRKNRDTLNRLNKSYIDDKLSNELLLLAYLEENNYCQSDLSKAYEELETVKEFSKDTNKKINKFLVANNLYRYTKQTSNKPLNLKYDLNPVSVIANGIEQIDLTAISPSTSAYLQRLNLVQSNNIELHLNKILSKSYTSFFSFLAQSKINNF